MNTGNKSAAAVEGATWQLSHPLASGLQNPALKRWPATNRTSPILCLFFFVSLFVRGTATIWVWYLKNLQYAAGIYIYANLSYVVSLIIMSVAAVARLVWMRTRCPVLQTDGNDSGPQHIVCVMLYNEPDDIVLETIRQLNSSPAAPRMHVVFAMEEGTNGPEERFKLYQSALHRVLRTRYYRHPKGLEREIRGLCSNVAWSMAQYSRELLADPANRDDDFSNFLFTKLDAQVLLHPEHFQELDQCFAAWQKGGSKRPVVFQPLPVSCLNREAAYCFSRAVCACRTMVYCIYFELGIMAVTCYSVPLRQYVGVGLHHPSFMAEDMMMVVQSNVAYKLWTKVWMMRVPVGTAPTLGANCFEALVELKKQCVRWAGQTMEAAEFAWRHGDYCSTGTLPFLLAFWWFRILVSDGLSPYSMLMNMPKPPGIPSPEREILEVSSLFLVVLLAAGLVFSAVIEQLFSACMPGHKFPWRQLPLTALSSPLALTFNSLVDFFGMLKFLIYGKAGIVLTHRVKAAVQLATEKPIELEGAISV